MLLVGIVWSALKFKTSVTIERILILSACFLRKSKLTFTHITHPVDYLYSRPYCCSDVYYWIVSCPVGVAISLILIWVRAEFMRGKVAYRRQ